jgi:outer membrane protein assembly factor BamB
MRADVDEFDLEATDGAARVGAGQTGRRRRRRRLRGWAAVALVLVAGGVYAAPPGGVLPAVGTGGVPVGVSDLRLAQEPTEAWRAAVVGDVGERVTAQLVGDTVLAVGTQGVVARDVATGAMLWDLDVERPSCSTNEQVVCVEHGARHDAQVVRIDASSGEQERVPVPGAWAAVDVGPDLVVVRGLAPGEITVARLQPDGTERWVLRRGGGYEASDGAVPTVSLRVTGDELQMDGWLVVDLGTGATVSSSGEALGDWSVTDGEQVRLRYEQGRPAVDVLVGDTVVATDQDFVLRPDDDLGGRIELGYLDRGDLDGVEARRTDTDEVLWTADSTQYPTARLDGVVLLVDWSEYETWVRAVDVRTGEELWSTPDQRWAFTGGDRTFAMVDVDGNLTGVDARTGRTRWRVGEARDLPVRVDGGMLVLTGDDLVRLDWPD